MSGLDSGDHGSSQQENVLTSVDALNRKLKMQKQFSVPKLELDEGIHESSHSRMGAYGKSMSTRRLLAPRRQDDFLRSASSHQLMSRPTSGGAPATFQGSRLTAIGDLSLPPSSTNQLDQEQGSSQPPARAESQTTEETAEDLLSDSEGDEDEDSFCDASKDELANKDYLKKDLGASFHDDELDIDHSDNEDDIIEEMKARMKIEGGPGDGEATTAASSD